jgi:crotonobetainyl-CoA:carnitine CoA-transferase CaiB-like acyl-CoA transferase
MPDSLEHLRVVELGGGLRASYAAKCLADLGADVVKVERPGGDIVRRWPPFIDDQPGPTRSGLFAYCNTNKRSIVVDYEQAEGQAFVLALTAEADVLIEGLAPGRLGELGLGVDVLQDENPQLIVTSVTPYGQTGPKRDWKGTDLTAHAATGIAMTTPLHVPDPASMPPLRPGGRQADFVAGLSSATATMFAIHQRRRTGHGSHVDVSAQEALASFTRMDIAYRTYSPDENRMAVSGAVREGPDSTLYGLVPCKDGYFAFQATEDYQWRGLMRALGSPAWAEREEFQDPYDRVARWAEIDVLMQQRTMEMTKLEIYAAGQAEHVPVFPCYTTAEAVADPQMVAREYFVDVGRDDTGSVTMPGPAVRQERTPVSYRRPWPDLAEHSDEILTPILGAERLAALRASGVVA